MADELSIQQTKQPGSYAVPGLLSGAAIGTIGGKIASNHGYGLTSQVDLDEVFKQEADTFKRQIEKGGDNKGAWEKAQEWANKYKAAETEYDKKVADITAANTIAKDPELANKLSEAQKAYETALNAEKAKLAKANVARIGNFPTAEEVKNLGSQVTIKDIKDYETLLKNYDQALDNAIKTADRTAIEDFEQVVNNALVDIENASKTPKKKLHKSPLSKKIDALKSEIEKIYPEITDAKRIQHELKVAGKDYKPGSKNYRKFVESLNKQVLAQREQMLNEILGEKIQVDIIDPKTKKVVGKRTTYANAENYVREINGRANAISKFKNRKDVKAHFGSLNPDEVRVYEDALKQLEKNKKSMTVDNYEKTRKALEAKKAIAEEYERLTTRLDARVNAIFNKLSYTAQLNDKVDKSIQNNSAVQSTFQKLRNFINGNEAVRNISTVAADTTMSADEIASRAAQNIEKTEVAVKFNQLSQAAKEQGTELTEKGKKLIEELGSKDEYANKVKDQAKKELEAVIKDLKLPSGLKTAGVAGAVLALAGLGIGSMMKKDA